jgi:LysM repeat protein
MYYFRLPADATFTLSADLTINDFAANNQVAFGLMVRDAMYIDTNSKDANGDSVNAAFFKLADMANAYNCYARKDGALVSGGKLANSYAIGDTVKLVLSGTADGYATTIGEEATVTGGFDFKLTNYDADYVYIGMFAARNADVTFSNIKLIVNGKEVDIFGTGEIPAEGEDTPDAPAVTGDVYVVQKGDTLKKIAKEAGITLQELLAVNEIENPNLIFKGMQINIPKAEKEKRYIVQKGDTLRKIAKAYGCTLKELLEVNEIENPSLIFPGDVVYLP